MIIRLVSCFTDHSRNEPFSNFLNFIEKFPCAYLKGGKNSFIHFKNNKTVVHSLFTASCLIDRLITRIKIDRAFNRFID